MYSTKATQSLKNLFARYHEPAPLSKQQSQKLLDGLKSSFRDQLDREYGHSPNRSAPDQQTTDAERAAIARHPAAKQHLKTLLSNPLFSYQKETSSTLPSPTPSPTRDPMDVFDHAVSKGMMNLKAATGCLKAKSQQLQLYPNGTSRAPGSDTALKVVRWLRSSRPENDLGFLDDRLFVKTLMPFLLSEGLESMAWEWTARTINDISKDKSRLRRAAFLLSDFVRAKSQPQHGGLDAAITTLLQVEDSFSSNPLLSKLLVYPWRSISWLSTVESYSRTAPSEKLFDAHVATAPLLHEPVDIETAHLHLYHPTHPEHTYALRLFQDTKKLQKLVQAITPKQISPAKSQRMGSMPWLAILGHDTVNFLTRSGRSQEAEEVTEVLQSELASLFTHNLNPT